MACIEVPIELQAELLQMINEAVIAAAGDKERAIELFTERFAETFEKKGVGPFARFLFNGVVKDVKPWHSGYDIQITPEFGTKHAGSSSGERP